MHSLNLAVGLEFPRLSPGEEGDAQRENSSSLQTGSFKFSSED